MKCVADSLVAVAKQRGLDKDKISELEETAKALQKASLVGRLIKAYDIEWTLLDLFVDAVWVGGVGALGAGFSVFARATPPPPPPPPPCPAAGVFRSAYEAANGHLNTLDYWRVFRGPRCTNGWAASHATTGISGSGNELTRCAWMVLRARNGKWVYYDFIMQWSQPCNPSRPDYEALRDPSYRPKMCSGEVPLAIRDWLGCRR